MLGLCRGMGTSQASRRAAQTPRLHQGGAQQPLQMCFGGAVEQRGLVTCPQPHSAGPAWHWKKEEDEVRLHLALRSSTGDAATSEHSPSRVTVALQVRLLPCRAVAWLGYLMRASPSPPEDRRA